MKKHRLMSILLASATMLSALCLFGCTADGGGNGATSESALTGGAAPSQESPTQEAPSDELPAEEVAYKLAGLSESIKILGVRNQPAENAITCDWTGSGIELDILHGGGDVTFRASATASCYFRAYVDGKEWRGDGRKLYYTVETAATNIVLKDVPAGEHRIRLVKVTGYTLARAQLLTVTFRGVVKKTAPADRELYIEFVGDSISCGWGNIGNHQGAYTDQDGTLAYPLMLAEALNADYSVTALSGKGLIYGNPEMTSGYRYASILRSKEKEYDFARKADMVVINIGTNDYSKRSSDNITEAAFKASYLAFLRTVAEKNGGDCKIFCLYNTMNDTFANAIIAAVAEFGGTAKNAYLVQMDRTASGHPSLLEHEKYFQALLPILKLEKLPKDPTSVPVIPDDQGGAPVTPPVSPVDPLPPVENPAGKLELIPEGEGDGVSFGDSEWTR